MADYAQTAPLKITTPLGTDVLLLTSFHGEEAISELFEFELALQAEKLTPIAFDKLLGQSVTVELSLPAASPRYFNGIVRQLKQSRQDDTFTYYQARVVPKFWLLTQNIQSRIFQQKSVPDILKEVLADLDVSFELVGKYPLHNYCVQLRESDFDFASRLMEEEGIFYYFKHTAEGHQLVLADTSSKNPTTPGQSAFHFDDARGGRREDNRISVWEKTQDLCPSHHLLWDYNFELPGQSLEAKDSIQASVQAGTVTHSLLSGVNQNLQIYDHPGGFAHRFDGIDAGGGEQTSDLSNIFQDNQRTVGIRMQQLAATSVVIEGVSDCGAFVPGFSFSLKAHYDGDGDYLLTHVSHSATSDSYRSSAQEGASYSNRFHCIPAQLPFRPRLKTPKAKVLGTQIAVVVGPEGEEIFTDKYGRVKVQFHWDRLGQNNASSSCWLRVLHSAAGSGWGSIHLPRVGHEVMVAFQDGDPDLPYVAGSVYNADKMPPFTLPDNRTRSGFKSHSRNGGPQNFSGIVFEDQQGSELLQMHSEKDMMVNAENNHIHNVANEHHQHVGKVNFRTVGGLPGKTTTPMAGSGSGGGKTTQRLRLGGKGNSSAARANNPQLPAPRGSGKGGGESSDFTSPVDWNQADSAGELGYAYSLVVGANVEATVGWCCEPIIGSYLEVIMNPAGMISSFGPGASLATGVIGAALGGSFGAMVDAGGGNAENAEWGMLVAGTAAVGGATTLIFGAEKQLLYGPQFEASHGTSFKYHSTVTVPLGLMATAVGLSFAAATIVPGVVPNQGASMLSGLGIDDLSSLLLEGLWLAESAVSAAQAEEKKAAEAKALAAQPAVVPPPTAEQLVQAAEKRVQDAISTVAEATQKVTSAVAGLQTVHSVDGDYTVNCKNLSLNAAAGMSWLFSDDETTACNINISSQGIADDGSISLSGNGQVTLTAGAGAVSILNDTPAAGAVVLNTGAEGMIALIRGEAEEVYNVPTMTMGESGIVISGGGLPISIYSGELVISINPEAGSIILQGASIELIAEELISFTVDDTELSLDAEGIQMLAASVTASHELEVDETITAKSKACAEDNVDAGLQSTL